MPPKETSEGPSFTFETMACVLAVLDTKGATLGNKAYDMMAKLDGKRSASAFQHQFRAVKARSKELAAELADDAGTPKAPRSAKKATTASGKKRGKKDAENSDDEDVPETPSKAKKTKVKKEPSLEASDIGSDINGLHGGFDNTTVPEWRKVELGYNSEESCS